MKKVVNMTYASSLTDLCEVNSSFDTGVLRIAYTGNNRNKSSISKQAFERSIKTMYNCPIVCHYDRETDSLGGHDVELVRDPDGALRVINMTTPVGVIPSEAKYWWDTVEESDGTLHEYLYTEILLWKRQEAYRKIKEDGITAHSMEITVKDGEMIDGYFHIYDFEFTAFALIGVEPCFESSALEVFSKQEFKQQFSEMMQDLKESFNLVNTSDSEVDDIHPHQISTEGGNEVLDKDLETVVETEDELETVVEEVVDTPAEEQTETDTPDEVQEETNQEEYNLTNNVLDELIQSLCGETVQCEWGEMPRYCYVDSDMEIGEVYCWDRTDWLLYGFTYTLDGDRVVIDFESKKRKKYVIADFDEGGQDSPFASTYTQMEQLIHDNAEWQTKYQNAEAELTELRQYKADVENAKATEARNEILANFSDLAGIEAFDKLCEQAMEYDVDTLEEKCYAIRGRSATITKFSLETKTPKLVFEKNDDAEGEVEEPYGGICEKYLNK